MDNTNTKILAMKPIINKTLSTIFDGTACLADYDQDNGCFVRNINHQYGTEGFIKHELVPTSLLEGKQLHFNTGYPFIVDELILIDKKVQSYIKNLLSLIKKALNEVIFYYKLNITFDKFDEKGDDYFFNFNKPRAMSCRLIIEMYPISNSDNKVLLSKNIDRFVVFFKRIEKEMVIVEQKQLFEKMNLIKEHMISKIDYVDACLNLDIFMSEHDFKNELTVIDMIRI